MTPPDSRFVYVTYIRTTQAQLWTALTTPEFMRQYWFGMHCDSTWTAGAPWRLVATDGTVLDAGEILEATPPHRLAIRWQHQSRPELHAEGVSLCAMELETQGEAVKLTITHSIDRPASRLIEAVAGGWPKILSNLKSLLETGAVALSSHSRAA